MAYLRLNIWLLDQVLEIDEVQEIPMRLDVVHGLIEKKDRRYLLGAI